MSNKSQKPLETLVIRPYRESDSIPELTALIHRAYKQLADMGLRYWGTHQSDEDTLRRIRHGEGWIAEIGDRVVGTITLTPPNFGGEKNPDTPPWYARPDVAKSGQLAVEPELQKLGIGSKLMDHVEQRAQELGAAELAGNTSEHAHHLIAYYQKRGFRIVGGFDSRPKVNYKSVILSKTLAASPA